ncbi:MAG: chemotaxis protein CheW [Zetaproteobacteria bacterium]|nr:chemotaxis protein CheW [Zetaproteobacteria bacterium]
MSSHPEQETEGLTSEEETDKQRYLVFKIQDQMYAFPLMNIQEVNGLLQITPLPNVPKYYRGLINLRGKIISVIDLRMKFGLKDIVDRDKSTSIVINILENSVIGCVVDEVAKVETFSNSQIDFSGETSGRQVGDGVVGIAKTIEKQKDGSEVQKMILILSIEKLLSKSDHRMLAQNEPEASK